jgi:hypothetical protein
MPQIERYEILVIGSGEAGKHVTWTLAQAGHRTAVVERKYIGGSCPNVACLPSKNVVYRTRCCATRFLPIPLPQRVWSIYLRVSLREPCAASGPWLNSQFHPRALNPEPLAPRLNLTGSVAI